jgi:hypothetical protein
MRIFALTRRRTMVTVERIQGEERHGRMRKRMGWLIRGVNE